MKRKREEFPTALTCFVVLSFMLEGEKILTDDMVSQAATEEKLQNIGHTDNPGSFWEAIGKTTDVPIVIFGSHGKGPSDLGGFSGVYYIEADGVEVDNDQLLQLKENWTRGQSGTEWPSDWKFLFKKVA